ncbi:MULTISPECIES: alkene reductase [unclassified Pseudomonas]|uniref:alkene reductase n=1 Tax=Pseudomonas TaxID=286 RepID=UPI0008712F2B|nr:MULTISPECIES: alkene reductase [unclassified Pseudomonas]SCW27017.1 N-ethylmaleimide reductase [Pseudomonas sp. NFACC56-3]SFK08740.1 N-ethylmaleimide reductase [Pseudomonas sp. NFACC52]
MPQHLFQPIALGPYTLPHRVAMAPLTRSRAGQPGDVPTAMNAEYYRQRASAALIITEATQISRQGQGYAWTPGIYNAEQVQAWRAVSAQVHESGGLIFMQLWHVGRVSHPSFQPDNARPVAPSALPVPGKTFIVDADGNGVWSDVPVPRALQAPEITDIIDDYRRAARNALDAGMDGVEIHAGNGYLLDQFINSNSNQREDAYGGSLENRARLLLEVVAAVVDEVGAERVGVRLTPMGRFMGMGDETPQATFGYIVRSLNQWTLAYLHLVEPAVVGTVKDEHFDPRWDEIIGQLRAAWNGVLMIAGGYDPETAEQALIDGRADIIAFGRAFLANPDLPRRIRDGLPLNTPDPSTFFGGDQRGYVDYPTHS